MQYVMSSDTDRVYADSGFGQTGGAGARPCLLIVDFSYGFTDSDSPMACSAESAVLATAQLLRRARETGALVVFTTVQYDAAGRQAARAFLAKAPRLAMLQPGSRWVQIDERIAPETAEPVIVKLWASAFFATPLASMLAARNCDTLVIVGASTSGCVRASAVDGLQHGYRVLVPRVAVADRAPRAHEASLSDIDAKYGDVVDLEVALAALGSLPNASLDR